VKLIAIGVKIGITGLLAWLLLQRVDLAAAGALLRSEGGAAAFLLAIAVLMGQAVIAGARTACVIRLLGGRGSIGRGFALWMIGLLVSQSLITFIAGDAARLWQFIRLGYSRRVASSVIVLERAVGLVVLLAMVLPGAPVLFAHAPPGAVRTGVTILTIVCAAGILTFVTSGFLGGVRGLLPARLRAHHLLEVAIDLASVARHIAPSWKRGASVVAASVLMQLSNVFAVFILARASGINIDLPATAAVALPSLLIAMMPVTVAGWGVREGAMIVGYGLFGVAPATALAVSVAFGLAMLVASLPGALFIRWGKEAKKPALSVN